MIPLSTRVFLGDGWARSSDTMGMQGTSVGAPPSRRKHRISTGKIRHLRTFYHDLQLWAE